MDKDALMLARQRITLLENNLHTVLTEGRPPPDDQLEAEIEAEYEGVLNAPDRELRKEHLDRLKDLLHQQAAGRLKTEAAE